VVHWEWRVVNAAERVERENNGMAKFNPLQFAQEVRQEAARVTWPSRKETWITTVAVVIMVTLSSLFFLAADQAIGFVVSSFLQVWR